ncbi:TPA: TIGR02584 family CRISPR-associated protein [Candidatus Marinimicrobia bacterium]|nr:TIGR02584 family CRISPR-associated protein [Candidatus Neomarinimicrobiota bacterium]
MRNEVFIAVVGTSPQVITEALYYFYSEAYPDHHRKFDRIILITTEEGQKRLKENLWENHKIEELEKALKLELGTIPLRKLDILCFKDEEGNPIQDLRTTENNINSLAQLFDVVMHWTSDPNTRVTAQLSGGRKTMSAFIALAFQLYAREHDEMFHILVPDDKMYQKDWFFPSNPNNPDEKLEVSFIPVIKVGRYLTNKITLDPFKLVKELQEKLIQIAPLHELVIEGNSFSSGSEKVTLEPRDAAFLRFLIMRRIESGCLDDCPGCEKCGITPFDLSMEYFKGKIHDIYDTFIDKGKRLAERPDLIRDKSKDFTGVVHQSISRIKRKLEQNESSNLNKTLKPYKAHLDKTQRKKCWYVVKVDPEIVKIIK